MTTATYNGIVFQDVRTHSVDSEVVYDTAGGVDPIYTRKIVVVESIFHTSTGDGLGHQITGELGIGVEAALRLLEIPRRPFNLTIGNSSLINVIPGATEPGVVIRGGGDIDLNNGPKPSWTLKEIVGTKTARITFRVELATAACGTPAGLTNLRWWTTDDVDENWFTTRKIDGKLRVATKNTNPHSLRNLIFPPLQNGFKRQSMSFIENPNGLELDFTINDLEVFRSAPKPTTTWSGVHRVTTNTPGGTVAEEEVTVTLNAPRDTPQTKLITLAQNILDSKLAFVREVGGKGSSDKNRVMLVNYAMEAALEDNRVTATARIKHVGDKGLLAVLKSGDFGQSLPADIGEEAYDPDVSRLLTAPTAGLSGIFISAMQTQCQPAVMPNAGGETETNPTARNIESPTKIDKATLPPEPEEDVYNQTHKDSMYLTSSVTSELVIAKGNKTLETGTSSSADAETETVDLTKGITTRIITVKATRLGLSPVAPNPADFTDANGIFHKFKNAVVTLYNAGQDSAKTPIFGAKAVLTFELRRTPELEEGGKDTVRPVQLQYTTSEAVQGSGAILKVSNLFLQGK